MVDKTGTYSGKANRPLGKSQLACLKSIIGFRAFIVGDRELRRLADLGLVRAAGPAGDSIFHITPSGLRYLATAAEQGLVELCPKLPSPTPEG